VGDRSNVKIAYESGAMIGFYTHWGGTELPTIVQTALKRGKPRWDDEAYLARIIFSEMIKDEVNELTGFGIYPGDHEYDEEHKTIFVNIKEQTVIIGCLSWTFEDYIKEEIFDNKEH